MSMTNQEEFAARLARVKTGGANTKSTIFVGQDEQHHIPREAPQKQAKGKEAASNTLYPLSLIAAFLIGIVGAGLFVYARFNLLDGKEGMSPSLDTDMVIALGIGFLFAFLLAQICRFTSSAHRGMLVAGVFAMTFGYHNFAHWLPGPMSALFSPNYVAHLRAESLPNSIRFRGVYIPILATSSALAAADPVAEAPAASPVAAPEPAALPDCPPEAGSDVVMLQTDNAKKPKKGAKNGHKTVAATSSDQTACKAP